MIAGGILIGVGLLVGGASIYFANRHENKKEFASSVRNIEIGVNYIKEHYPDRLEFALRKRAFIPSLEEVQTYLGMLEDQKIPYYLYKKIIIEENMSYLDKAMQKKILYTEKCHLLEMARKIRTENKRKRLLKAEIEKEAIIKLEEVYKNFTSADLDEFEKYDEKFEEIKKAALPTENKDLLENVIIIEEIRIDASKRYLAEQERIRKEKEKEEAERRRIEEEEEAERIYRKQQEEKRRKRREAKRKEIIDNCLYEKVETFPKTYNGNISTVPKCIIESDWHRERDDALDEIKIEALVEGCSLLVDVEYSHETKSDPETGYRYRLWSAKGKASRYR